MWQNYQQSRRASAPSVLPLSSYLQIKTFFPRWQNPSCTANLKVVFVLFCLYLNLTMSASLKSILRVLNASLPAINVNKRKQLKMMRRWTDSGPGWKNLLIKRIMYFNNGEKKKINLWKKDGPLFLSVIFNQSHNQVLLGESKAALTYLLCLVGIN